MLDIRFVRENPEIVKENIRKKFQDSKLPMVDEVIALDADRRKAQQEADELKAAKNMLLDTECSCAMVSAAFGFSSQSYFTRMFRLYTGETPKKFREKYMQSGL